MVKRKFKVPKSFKKLKRRYGGAKGWTWDKINRSLAAAYMPAPSWYDQVGRIWKLKNKRSDIYKKTKPNPATYAGWKDYITALNVGLSYATAKPGNKGKKMGMDEIVSYARKHAGQAKRYVGYRKLLPPLGVVGHVMENDIPIANISDAGLARYRKANKVTKRQIARWNRSLKQWNKMAAKRYKGQHWPSIMGDFK